MTSSAVVLCLFLLAAIQTAAQECIKASTATDILEVVKRTNGYSLICLDGENDRCAAHFANNRSHGCCLHAEKGENCTPSYKILLLSIQASQICLQPPRCPLVRLHLFVMLPSDWPSLPVYTFLYLVGAM